MSVNIVSYFRPAPQSRDWNNQELAEFYRVEASLIRSGVSVETDRGLSDEGDPWFIFCRADTDDVIIHFARIDGDYIVASPAFDSCARGRQFRPLIEKLIDSHPLVLPKSKEGGKLFIHPAALLVALVTTCFFKLGQTDAVAGEAKASHATSSGTDSSVQKESRGGTQAVVLDERATTIILAAIAAAVAWTQTEGAGALASSVPLTVSFEFSNQGQLGALASGEASLDSPQGGQYRSHTSNYFNPVDGTADGASSFSLVVSLTRPFDATHTHIAVTPKVLAVDNMPTASHEVEPASVAPTFLHVAVPVVVAQTFNQAVAAASDANGNSTSTSSYAAQEVGLVLGGSLQTHLIHDLSGTEQQLVLSVATAQPFSNESAPLTTAGATHTAPATVAPPVVAATTGASTADAAIQQFTAAHPDFQLLQSGSEVILYDPHLTPTNLSAATQETFSFPDGSSIFLIGLPATAHSLIIAS